MNDNMDIFATKTIDTVFEYDENGNVIHRVTTETVEFPEEVSVETDTTIDFPDDDFDDVLFVAENDTDIPTAFEIVKATICGAALFATGCAIYKALRN